MQPRVTEVASFSGPHDILLISTIVHQCAYVLHRRKWGQMRDDPIKFAFELLSHWVSVCPTKKMDFNAVLLSYNKMINIFFFFTIIFTNNIYIFYFSLILL